MSTVLEQAAGDINSITIDPPPPPFQNNKYDQVLVTTSHDFTLTTSPLTDGTLGTYFYICCSPCVYHVYIMCVVHSFVSLFTHGKERKKTLAVL